MEQYEDQPQTSGGRGVWLWVLIILLVLGIGIGSYFYFNSEKDKSDRESTNDTASSGTTDNRETLETWVKTTASLKTQATSSSTIKLSAGSYRMYLNNAGAIKYYDFANPTELSAGVSTGITEDTGKMISNPAVLKITETSWIMIYEQAPMRVPGSSGNLTPSASNQRNLYLATSSDGKAFIKAGLAVDSSADDRFFASVPDLILLPDKKIRMYYVSYGDRIASRTSSDDGKTWVKDAGIRKGDQAVDPDITYMTENGKTKWTMYYSDLDPTRNALYKATSTDGLMWSESQKILDRDNENGVIVDPDVFQISVTKYGMFFGESTSASAEINLYYAETSESIF